MIQLIPPPADNNYGVTAIDTESVNTNKGLDVCKVTVIDINCTVVYDEYCLPTSDIIDYITYWSGIKKENLHVRKTFAELRDDLLIRHIKIIDTVLLYPHLMGLPRRRSLKDIASSELQRKIQVGGSRFVECQHICDRSTQYQHLHQKPLSVALVLQRQFLHQAVEEGGMDMQKQELLQCQHCTITPRLLVTTHDHLLKELDVIRERH
ncbi:hypothetical protein DPMN_038036 [Dreissena polymorpha]|uniref:Exonuclease domain-containing protein n=1 Tax=Dreissena polymorpha TaxID=45954 RepID=A0A9D4RPS6_DREPO|nr:hypothetical protein DPMN_038036 [Dreissena polymorpha]